MPLPASDDLAVSAPLSHRVALRPAGDRLDLRTDSEAVVDCARSLWADDDQPPEHGGVGALGFTVNAFDGERVVHDLDALETWEGGRPRFTVAAGDHLHASLDLGTARVVARVSRQALIAAPETVARLLLEAPCAALLASRGWQVVHAATMVGVAGAVVVRAATGGGKSVLAAAAWQAGLRVLGDESVLVHRLHHERVAASVREVLLERPGADLLGLRERTVAVRRGAATKLRLRLGAGPAPAEREARHVATVLLGDLEAPGGARLVTLGGDEFLAAFDLGAIPQERWYGSASRVARAWSDRPTYRLEGHADIDGAVRLVSRLCDGGAGS